MGLRESEHMEKMIKVGNFVCYQVAVETQGTATGNGRVYRLLIMQT